MKRLFACGFSISTYIMEKYELRFEKALSYIKIFNIQNVFASIRKFVSQRHSKTFPPEYMFCNGSNLTFVQEFLSGTAKQAVIREKEDQDFDKIFKETTTTLEAQTIRSVLFGKIKYGNYDPIPRIYSPNGLEYLPAGNQAHKMSDMVSVWIEKLRNSIDNVFDIFGEELYEAENLLPIDVFNELCESLKSGVEHALNGFAKWMKVWIHLPLSVCRLGGDYGSDYARAFLHVFYSRPESDYSTLQEKSYIKSLQEDIINNNKNTFGLLEALSDQNFFEQFDSFASEFIKYRIYSVVIYEQQLEGLFNRYDIRVDPNMSAEFQQARLQISGLDGVESKK
ncbi:hypothetical protein RhiirB3_448823 [Rhizophagus irregularis]|nr:hypothetical protein RhiirB3_448823 [Rhizophagus irregularis]